MEDFDEMSPAKWAHAFLAVVRANPKLLESDDFTAGWFHNAIECAKDEVSQGDRARLNHFERELRAIVYYVSHHCHSNRIPVVELDTPLEERLERLLSGDRSMLSFVREHMNRLSAGEIKG